MNEQEALKQITNELAPAVTKDAQFVESVSKAVLNAVKAENALRERATAIAAGKFDAEYKNNVIKLFEATTKGERSQIANIAKNMNVTTTTDGGYFVPTEFMGEAARLATLFGVFRRNAQVLQFKGQKATKVTIADVTVAVQTELGTKAHSQPTIGQISIDMKTIYTMTVLSNQLEDFSGVSVFDILLRRTAEAMASFEDSIGLVGSATFTGGILQNSAAFTTVTAAANTSGATLTSADALAAIKQLSPSAMANAKWYMSFTQFINFLLEVDSNGRYINDVASAIANRVYLGFPVELSGYLPTAAGAAAKTCFIGDLRASAILVEGVKTKVDVADQATVNSINTFEANAKALRVEQYRDVVSYDASPKLEDSLKSIVILKTHA